MQLAKTTVYVAEVDYRRLKAIAQAQKRYRELVRGAIAVYAGRHGPRATARSVGVGRSGRGDLSERAEELLSGEGEPRRRSWLTSRPGSSEWSGATRAV